MTKTYTAADAAEVAGVAHSTILNWIKSGRLNARRQDRETGGRSAWVIAHDDLMAVVKGKPLFTMPEPTMPLMALDDPDSRTMDATSITVAFPLEDREERFSLDLFRGYDRLRAVTYSVSLSMIHRLLTTMDFNEFSVIFGSEKLVTGTVEDIVNFQNAIPQLVSEAFLGIGGVDSDRAQPILDSIASGTGEFLKMKDKVVHSKIYLLDGKRGRRVMVGSANMSEMAFSGRQGEVMLAFDDSTFMWDHCERKFTDLRELATSEIQLAPTTPGEIVNVDQIGLFNDVAKEKKPVKIYVPSDIDDSPGSVERLGVLQDAAYPTLDIALQGVKPDKKGIVEFTPAIVEKVKKNVMLAQPKKADRQSLLSLRYSPDGRFIFNDGVVERPMEFDPIQADADLITTYINNYAQFGSGGEDMQANYFALMAWMYFTPFISRVRGYEIAAHNAGYRGNTKLAAILYGEPSCGKTNVVQLLFTSMFNAYKPFTDDDFTTRKVTQYQTGLFPLFYDDISKKRFGAAGAGTNIIKRLDHIAQRAAEYPCIVVSLNHDTYELPSVVLKRSLAIYTDTPLPLDDKELTDKMENSANQIHNRIGTAFFREYLYRMNDKLSDNPADYDNFDYLEESSTLIVDIFRQSLGPGERLPAWCKPVTTEKFNRVYWGSKRVVVDRNLDIKAFDSNFPPQEGRWTRRGNDLIIGADAFNRKALSERLPQHIVNSSYTRGNTIYLHADRTIEFMRRGRGHWQDWRVPKPNIFKRLIPGLT